VKFTLRTQVAVLALLAPLGAAIAQPSAFNDRGFVRVQAPYGAAAPAIERFVLRQEGRIQPGEQVRYRLVGTPGGRARLHVPGVIRSISMTEARPGVYIATYVVRRNDNRNAFPRALVTLEKNGLRQNARVQVVNDREFAGDAPRERDERPPQISELSPANGDRIREHGRTQISAKLSDEGSGVDRSTVVMRVNGRDVTHRVRFEGDEVRFRDNLNDGRHTAELMLRDNAGNTSRTSWTFDVVDRGPRGPGGNR
jgi:hypothetical protein